MTDGVEGLMALVQKFGIKLTITPLPGKSTKKVHRKVTYLTGLMPTSDEFEIDGLRVPYVVYSNSLCNALEAIIKRLFLVQNKVTKVYAVPPTPRKGAFDDLQHLIRDLGNKLQDHCVISPEEYVEDTPAHRRAAYRRALDNIRQHIHNDKWRNVNFFVKAQKEEGKESRAICPLGDEAIIEQGVYVKSLETRSRGEMSLYEAIDLLWQERCDVVYPVCSKGKDTKAWAQVLRQKWTRFDDPVELEFDCSRFSQHTGEKALGLVVDLIEMVFPDSRSTMQPAKSPLSVALPDETGQQYMINTIIKILLLDGTPWTAASAHVIINAIMIHLCPNVEVEPMDCGDDFGLICERRHADLFLEYVPKLREFGYTLKLELDRPNDIFNRLSFCRQSPCYIDGAWVMLRPPSCLYKDCILLCQEKDAKDRMFAVGMGGAHLNEGVPVYHNFYRAMVRLSGQTRMRKKHLAYIYSHRYQYYETLLQGISDSALRPRTYSAMDRTQFYLTTGITPRQQEILEFKYDSAAWGEPKEWCQFWADEERSD